jgi:hypothetical protein
MRTEFDSPFSFAKHKIGPQYCTEENGSSGSTWLACRGVREPAQLQAVAFSLARAVSALEADAVGWRRVHQINRQHHSGAAVSLPVNVPHTASCSSFSLVRAAIYLQVTNKKVER